MRAGENMSEKQIYKLTAEILVLAHNPKDAEETAHKQVFINDLLKYPVLEDWSHFDEPSLYQTPKQREELKQKAIARITRELQTRR